MTINEPVEINEARKLLSEFEKTDNPSEKSEYFNEAFEVLNNYLNYSPDEKHSTLAKNIKVTYAKKILADFPDGSSLDLIDWLQYLLIIVSNPIDFTPLLESDEILNNKMKEHCSFWAEDIKKNEKTNLTN